jgi:ribosomal protein S17E
MGKAMSNKIKAKAKILLNEFKSDFGTDFTKNKDFLKSINLPLSKLTINLMSGYITRYIKNEKKEQEALKIKVQDSKVVPTKAPTDKTISH